MLSDRIVTDKRYLGIVVERYQDEDFYSYFEGKLKNERNIHIDAHSYIERIVRNVKNFNFFPRRTKSMIPPQANKIIR